MADEEKESRDKEPRKKKILVMQYFSFVYSLG